MSAQATISFVLATYNRRDVLLATLQRLHSIAPETPGAEIIVVDNASNDGTAGAVRRRFPDVHLLQLRRNAGSCAKAFGADEARGEFVVFLDDDSFPRSGSLTRMVERFREDERLGAAGFRVHLPDGREECSALPDVFVGCGVGFRREAVEEVGGLDRGFFMQAEEYDLSFRLAIAGWGVRTFGDLHVDHLKSPVARVSERTVYHDTRNNLIVAARYLPDECVAEYAADWSQRYGWFAEMAEARTTYWRARASAAMRWWRERRGWKRSRLTPQAFEQFFSWSRIDARFRVLQDEGVERVLLVDLGKNIYPFVRSARGRGIRICAIADYRFAGAGWEYRGIPIVDREAAAGMSFDAVVVANTSPLHALQAEQRISRVTNAPIHRWFGRDLTAPATPETRIVCPSHVAEAACV